jgi:hypothetical protein
VAATASSTSTVAGFIPVAVVCCIPLTFAHPPVAEA